MLHKMGPVRNQENEDDFCDSLMLSRRNSHSTCNSPDLDSHTMHSPGSTFSCPGVIEHESDQPRTDAWMGYTGVWPRHDIFASQRPPAPSVNFHQQTTSPPPLLHSQQSPRPLSRSVRPLTSCVSMTTTSSSLAYNNVAETVTSDSEDLISRGGSSPNHRSQQGQWTGVPRQLSSRSSGLVDISELTRPIQMLSDTDCIPISEKSVSYAISMADGGKSMRNVLKRKLSRSGVSSCGGSTSTSSSDQIDDARTEKKRRFTRTTEALKKLGLWEVAIRTGKMIVQNRQLQMDLDQLKQDSKQLMMSVLRNPENEKLKIALATMQARINAHKHQTFYSCNVSIKT